MWLTLLACGSPETPPETPAAAPEVHAAHAAHDTMAEHMEAMGRTRDALRARLGAAYDAQVPGLEQADASKGRETYTTHCAACHGDAGKGDGPAAAGLNPPPGDLTDPFHARFYADAGRVEIIRAGIPETSMAGFAGALTDAQILDVYAYIRPMRGAP
jgi:high-affinity iron transporter